MIWFWTRDDRECAVETRYDNQTREFVMVIKDEGGGETTERYSELQAFSARLIALRHSLEAERWKQKGLTRIDPNGFPNRHLL